MKIPVYTSSVGTSGGTSARLTGQPLAGAFGGDITAASVASKALNALSSQLNKRAAQIKKEKDATAAMSAFVQASESGTELLYNTENGILNQKGQNAIGSYRKVETAFDDIKAELYMNLENAEQQAAFDTLWQRKQITLQDLVARHEATEFQSWKKNTGVAAAKNAVNQGTLSDGDPTLISQSMEQIKVAVYTAHAGESQEEKDNLIRNYTSDMHVGLLQNMVETDYKKAEEYFEMFQEDIAPGARAALTKRIEIQKNKQQAVFTADAVWFDVEGGFEEKLAATDKIKDADLRSRVKSLIRARINDAEEMEARATKAESKSVTSKIKAAGSLANAYAIAEGLDDAGKITKFKALSNLLYGTKQAVVVSNPKSLAQARAMIDTGEIDDEDLLVSSYAGQISKSDMKTLQKRLMKGGNTGMLSDSNMRTLYSSFTGKKVPENTEEFNMVVEYIENNIPPGKDPNDKLIREMMATALTTGEKIGKWFDPDMSYAEALAKGEGDQWLPDLGDQNKHYESLLLNRGIGTSTRNRRIAKKLDMFGVPVTAKNIKIYREKYGLNDI